MTKFCVFHRYYPNVDSWHEKPIYIAVDKILCIERYEKWCFTKIHIFGNIYDVCEDVETVLKRIEACQKGE